MKNTYLLLLYFLLPFFGCKKDKFLESEIKESETGRLEDINVGNGFDFKTHQAVTFELTTVDSAGAAKEPVKIKIHGLDHANQKDELFSGSSLDMYYEFKKLFKNVEVLLNGKLNLFFLHCIIVTEEVIDI